MAEIGGWCIQLLLGRRRMSGRCAMEMLFQKARKLLNAPCNELYVNLEDGGNVYGATGVYRDA